MKSTGDTLRIGLATEDFLPYTHVWVYRQMESRERRPCVVLCRGRVEAEAFAFDSIVCSPPPSRMAQALKARLWPFFRHVKARLTPRNHRDFLMAIREHRIGLVHAHFGTMAVLMEPVCREAGIPLLVTFHGFDVTAAPLRWPAYGEQVKRMLRGGAFVAAITKEMATRAMELGADPARVFQSYLGVPVKEFRFLDRSGRSGPVHFLHAGRLTAKKGVPDLVRAFARAFPIKAEAMLTIAGDGEEMDLVRASVKEVRPASDVRILGRVSDDTLDRLRREADVFVANCRTDEAGTREGLPIAIIEAASTGLPVLSTWHAGIPEAVENGVSGRLVLERDGVALAAALREMADRPRLLKWGRAGRLRMENMFDLEKCNDVLWQVYASVAPSSNPWHREGEGTA